MSEAFDLKITQRAVERVSDLLVEEGVEGLRLRIFVQGGGCSGFEYGFTFDTNQESDDYVVTSSGVSFLVDSMSAQYLIGATVDYKEDVYGAQFVIDNPNATSTCGCGASFSV